MSPTSASVQEPWVVTSYGVKMPRLIYGSAWKKERTTELVLDAVRSGFRGIDTACQPKHYREDLVGDALVALQKEGYRRKDLFVQTKFTPVEGQDPENIPYDPAAPLTEQVSQSFAISQKNLKTSYVDSLVLHSPGKTHEETMEIWRAMEEIFDLRGAKQLGISNCYDLASLKALYNEARIKPAVVQNRFHEISGFDTELRHWCATQGIRYQSFWTLTANKKALASENVAAVAKSRGYTPEQVILRFALDEEMCPLIGATSKEHMADDMRLLSEPCLTKDDGVTVARSLFAASTKAKPRSQCSIL